MTSPFTWLDHGRDLADQIAERLDEAARTLAVLPCHGLRPASVKAAWPDVVQHWVDLEWPTESDIRPPRPTGVQIQQMDEALGWVALIGSHETILRRVINMRLIVHPISLMHRYNWRQIGEAIGVSHHTAKSRHRQACQAIAKKIAVPAFSSSISSVFAHL